MKPLSHLNSYNDEMQIQLKSPRLVLISKLFQTEWNYNISTKIAFRVDFNECTINFLIVRRKQSFKRKFFLHFPRKWIVSFLFALLSNFSDTFFSGAVRRISFWMNHDREKKNKKRNHSREARREWKRETYSNFIYMHFPTTINHCHQVTSWENENTWIQYIL